MTYKVTGGISETELPDWLRSAAKKLGTFDDGRVDYTNASVAPIVMCTVICRNDLLIVKRAYGLADAEGYWSTVNGFIDDIKPVKAQVQQEIKEELGLEVSDVNIKVGGSYSIQNPQEKRRYIVFPCRVSFSRKPEVRLDSEHTEFAWIKRSELERYDVLDDLPLAIDSALKA